MGKQFNLSKQYQANNGPFKTKVNLSFCYVEKTFFYTSILQPCKSLTKQ